MSRHSEHSSCREKLIEHLLVGELLKLSLKHGDCGLEVAKPEVDNAGFDLIVEQNGLIRHIQLKASYLGATTTRQKVHVRLQSKPSGCVVWVMFDESTLKLGPFLYFGSEPGAPLPSLEGTKVALHTKGDKGGHKAERSNIRILSKGQFDTHETINSLYEALFGFARNG